MNSPLSRWLTGLLLLFVLFGAALRLTNLDRKIFWTDEVCTALRVSGYTQDDLGAFFDGRTHRVSEIQKLQRVDPQHGLKETVHSLVVDDPQHPPLFYGAERLFAAIAGSSPASLRIIAAVMSIAAIGAAFWFCRELFGDTAAAFIAAAIIAVSPFHVVYAHEAREYSLWTFALFILATTFLRLVRRQSPANYCWYGFSVALALYADLLSAYVILALSLYAVSRFFRRPLLLFRIAAVTAAGVGIFGVWIVRIWAHSSIFSSGIIWGAYTYPLKQTLQKWVFNVAATLFDLEYVNLHFVPIVGFVLIVILAALVLTVRFAKPLQMRFFWLFGGVITLAILFGDMHAHTYYSTIARYLTPLWISIDCALAFAFARLVRSRHSGLRVSSTAILLIVLGLGAWSSTVGNASEAWWDNHINADARELTAVVDETANPLLLTTYRPDTVLVLSQYLRPTDTLLMIANRLPSRLPSGYSAYFILSPDESERKFAARLRNFTVGPENDFMDDASPVEKFHSALRRGQAARGMRPRYTPQEFLLQLIPR